MAKFHNLEYLSRFEFWSWKWWSLHGWQPVLAYSIIARNRGYRFLLNVWNKTCTWYEVREVLIRYFMQKMFGCWGMFCMWQRFCLWCLRKPQQQTPMSSWFFLTVDATSPSLYPPANAHILMVKLRILVWRSTKNYFLGIIPREKTWISWPKKNAHQNFT